MKQLFELKIKGKNKKWTFFIDGELKYLKDWTEDGLNISPSRKIKPFWFNFSRNKKLMSVETRGKYKDWSFHFEGSENELEEWWDDDLNISIIYGIVPVWAVEYGLTNYFLAFQNLLNKIGL